MRGKKEVMNSEKEGHHQRTETSRTKIIGSESEGSKYNCNVDEDRKDEEVKQIRKIGLHEVLRNVSDDIYENGHALYGDTEDVNRPPTEGEGHCANILQPNDVTRGKDMCYERESKHCLTGPPLNLVVPHIPPPGQPDQLKVIKVSNVVGINPKPFDPETYMEEDDFITDESKGKKSVHTDVVRCRRAKNADGTESLESNARFVQWKDGSMQLLIGHVALDVSIEESSQHTHLFRKNGKGLLQSQGRLLQKMRIMPPESSSRSHSSLTAPVDSQNEKTIKVQTWYDKKYPERMKQERERAEEKNIQARSILRKKKEKVNHKYTQSHKGKQKLTSGFFDEALDEDEAPSSWYNPHGRVAHSGFEHNLEFEALAQRRIINAKVHEYSDSESEELEYGTEFKDIESSPRHEREYELDENNVYDKDLDVSSLPNEEIEGPEHKRGPRKGRVIDFGEELYPPKKRFLNRWRRQLLLTAMMSEKNCQHQTEQSKRY
ncbi:protein LEO1 homolog isoform X3 [Triticum aestivum]|uniref:RNA polymerase-associated protein LEO1 n=4 Tax=Aegilops tauschii subsp. strangulata TaxID=200361 RepID=A0A453LUH7_AEGTS|nr:protein LEO1 homolog isoform X3 [Triticum aestivum]XP_045085127.1 protein LEO1 homolog isoform X3 [Aegilops tauschii subsp. strangulata]XP_045085128.1 protein LEO1 homolog isoform X3 [Aegilops tauschii subsp. strangulata]